MNIPSQPNIIFDLGGVILNLNYDNTVREFQRIIPHLDPATFYGKENQLPFFSEYETGKIPTDVFKMKFEDHYQIKLSEDDFTHCWNSMILDFPLKHIESLKKLKTQKKLFLLSNINPLHEEAVNDAFSKLNAKETFHSLFNKTYYSHHLGLRKPSIEVFNLILNENNLLPEETIFFDDSAHHIEGARKAGLTAIQITGLNFDHL